MTILSFMVSRVFVSIYTSIQSVPFESILLVTEDYLNIMQSGKQLLSQMKRQTSNQPTKSIKLWCIKRSQQKISRTYSTLDIDKSKFQIKYF